MQQTLGQGLRHADYRLGHHDSITGGSLAGIVQSFGTTGPAPQTKWLRRIFDDTVEVVGAAQCTTDPLQKASRALLKPKAIPLLGGGAGLQAARAGGQLAVRSFFPMFLAHSCPFQPSLRRAHFPFSF